MIDKTRYEKEVLGPAADNGNTVPPDLFVRYGLGASSKLDPGAFDQHVAEMAKLWRAFGVKSRRLRPVTDAMLAAHAELSDAGQLTWEHFESGRKAHGEKARARLKDQIHALAVNSPCVSAATIRHLAAGSAGTVSETDVARMLSAARVRVVEPLWKLPDPPPSGRSLRTNLKTLGLELSADLVFGKAQVRRGFKFKDGFRLDSGERLTGDIIGAKKAEALAKTFDARKSASDSVFAVLEKAARDDRLDDLVRWEIAEVLRESVDAQMPFKLVAGEAKTLGLNPLEADELTLSLIEQRSGAAGGRGPATDIEAALAEGNLREAERLRGGLGDDHADLRARLDALSAQVTAASNDAAKALSAGRTEEAAELLAGAIRIAADDDALAQRLAAIPPPPVTGVLTGVDGTRVAISWRPSAARAGKITYRVVRTLNAPAPSASAGRSVAEVPGNDTADPAPPAAVDLHYTVFARRDEGSWSAPAAGPSVRCLPEVIGVSLTADEHTVRGSWTAHHDVSHVEVVRLGDSRTLKAAREGFTDDDVSPGNTYRYRIRAVYRSPSGGREVTPGIEARVTSETAPRELSEVTVVAESTSIARVTWTAPAGGRVVVRTARTAPTWSAGDQLTVAEVERYGQEVSGNPAPAGDGRFSLTAPLGSARQYFAAVTVGGGKAIAGPFGSIRVAVPVRELTVRRFPGKARLSWIWPEGATSALITWTPQGGKAEPAIELGERAYKNNGGCVLEVGSSAGRVEVRAITKDAEGIVESPPVRASVSASGMRVSYEFRRRRFKAGRAILRLTVESASHVPSLDIVHGTGHVQPIRRDQGTTLLRTDPQQINPSEPFEVEFDVPKSSRSWLVCFGPDDGSVTLIRLRGNW